MVGSSRISVSSMSRCVLVLMMFFKLSQSLTKAGTFFAFTSPKISSLVGSYSVVEPPDPWAKLRSILSQEMSKLPSMLDHEFDMQIYNVSRDIGVEIRGLRSSVTQGVEDTLPAHRPPIGQGPRVPPGNLIVPGPRYGYGSPTAPPTSLIDVKTTTVPELVTKAQISAGHLEESLRQMHNIADGIKGKLELEVNKVRGEFKSSMEVLENSITNITTSHMKLFEKHLDDHTKEVRESLELILLSGKKGIAVLQKKFEKISKAINDLKKNTQGTTTTPIPTTTTPIPTTTMPIPSTTTTIYAEETTELLEDIVTSLMKAHNSFMPSVSKEVLSKEIMTPTPEDTTTEEPVHGRECTEVLHNGHTTSGVYLIRVDDLPIQTVYCDQETDGGGWTVFLARKKNETEDFKVDFKRGWQEYKKPFGDAAGEYWIGLETLYALTRNLDFELYVDMETHNDTAYSRYKFFGIGPEGTYRTGYQLKVWDFDFGSPAGDAMAVHNGKDFTTKDEDNDEAPGGNCAEWSGGGGWWYDYCFRTNPTGGFPPEDMEEGHQEDTLVEWRPWKGDYVYLEAISFKIRPRGLAESKKSLKAL